MKTYLAIDLGGTFLKYALVEENGSYHHQGKVPTPNCIEDLWTALADLSQKAKAICPIEGMAISAPGAVDSKTGIIGGASALPYIHGPNFKEEIMKHCHLNAEIENDANCAALAEVWQGNAKDCQDAMFIVIGTGIGGAIIKDRQIHKGVHLHGGEFGYTVQEFDYDAKTFKTWSDVGSTISIVNRVAQAKQVDPSTLSGEDIFAHVNDDPICQKEVDFFYYHLAIGIYNLQYVYDPEVIIIGGGVSNQPDLENQINRRLDEILKKVSIAHIHPEVKTCYFKNDANLIGAVYHYIQNQSLI